MLIKSVIYVYITNLEQTLTLAENESKDFSVNAGLICQRELADN